jgi:hypothetical protein
MNSIDVQRSPRHGRVPADPMGYVFRRLSSLAVIVGLIAGLIGAVLVESAGLPGPVVLGAGLVVFLGTTSLAARLAAGHLVPQRRDGSR